MRHAGFYDAGGRYAPHEARWRRDFATRGIAGPFRGAFPRDVASALAAGAVAEPGRPQASYFHRDVAAPLAAGAFPGDLEATLAAILDDATCCRRATPPFAVDNFADAWPRRSGREEKAFATNVVAHARATPGVAAWRCPSGREAVATGLSPWGLGVANGHHVDHGPHGAAWDFALEDQLLAPWCVVYVLLTDVARDQGPTVAWPGSQRVMANILAGLGPWRRLLLDTPRMYALCAAADSYFADADAMTLVGAAGAAAPGTASSNLWNPMYLRNALNIGSVAMTDSTFFICREVEVRIRSRLGLGLGLGESRVRAGPK
jgi:hypothetical protein